MFLDLRSTGEIKNYVELEIQIQLKGEGIIVPLDRPRRVNGKIEKIYYS